MTRVLSLAGALVSISFCSGCNEQPKPERQTPIVAVASPQAPRVVAQPAPLVPAQAAPPLKKASSAGLGVKRFVIGSGVENREPLIANEPLISDGSPIYAFAELSNVPGESENVRITFERRGAKERVGDVSLPVPGNVARHRTWAFTRFIRAPGVWDAVLWSEDGVELSRASFEVTAG